MDSELKSVNKSGRSMRLKDRPTYLADIDDEIDGTWSFDLTEKLNSDKFAFKNKFFDDLNGSDVTVEFFQKNGFTKPILVREKSGLGLRIPSENFSVSDVKRCVGSRRVLDVMDVRTQKGIEMSLKEWVQYFEDKKQHKDRLLNVISLEFSHTRLEDYVDQPRVVSDLDWVNCVWPWYFKELQSQATNELDSMMYPKVQKYCLMSVGGCYTDFHIDMGGTSVWYHILRGAKVFWFIPPTEENLSLFIKWTLSPTQSDVFFGDIVKTCYRITLEEGWTFFIPTGWIHAVYTPVDSLVFGGNFLHSFGMPLQLGIADIEVKTHVPVKFRYPLFKELHWYVLERYVSCLMGIEHRELSERELLLENGEVNIVEDLPIKIERNENKVKVELKTDSPATEFDPSIALEISLSDTMPLFDEEVVSTYDVEMSCPKVVQVESDDKATCELSTGENVNGCSIDQKLTPSVLSVQKGQVKLSDLKKKRLSRMAEIRAKMSPIRLTQYEIEGLREVSVWLENLPLNKRGVPKDISEPDQLLQDCRVLLDSHKYDDHEDAITGEIVLKWPPRKQPKRPKAKVSQNDGTKNAVAAVSASSTRRRRRVRCKQCEPCTRPDCRECVFCLDLKKYGGPQKMKQTCVSRRCLAPLLAKDATCELCGKGDAPHPVESCWWDDAGEEDWSSWLMECRVCCEVVHPACLRLEITETTFAGILDEDLPSSWDCCRCCQRGLQGQCRPRYVKIFNERASRPSNNETQSSAIESTRSTTPKQKENHGQVTHSICSSHKAKTDLAKFGESTKFCESKERQLKRDDSRSCERDEVKKKAVKLVKTKRPRSPDMSTEIDEPLAAVRFNSRGREITVPRRYLV